jgi:GntR family transcriptional regulator
MAPIGWSGDSNAMQLRISIQDGAPIYQQIVEQVKYLVAAGRLKPGEDVPPIRVLAEQLRINPNTVARAYLELERAGVVTMRQGFGTKVAQVKTLLSRREKLRLLAEPADMLLTHAHHLNVELDEVITLLRERDAVMQPESSK